MVLAAVALLAVGCSGDDGPSDDGLSAQPFRLELSRGECFDRPASPDVTDVPAVPCRQPHDLEVFAVVNLGEGDYPGGAAAASQGGSVCEERFADYVGAPPDESGLLIVPYVPDQQAWESGDRRVVCAVALNEGRLEGSVEGREAPQG